MLSKNATNLTERIQRNFNRYALQYPTINYNERCEYLNILDNDAIS